MLTLHKILLPVVFTDNSPHFRQLACQAAWLARHFHAEIILLHVVTPSSYPTACLRAPRDHRARSAGQSRSMAQKDLDEALLPQLEGIAVTRILLRGDRQGNSGSSPGSRCGMIVMSTRARAFSTVCCWDRLRRRSCTKAPAHLDRRTFSRVAGRRSRDAPT